MVLELFMEAVLQRSRGAERVKGRVMEREKCPVGVSVLELIPAVRLLVC